MVAWRQGGAHQPGVELGGGLLLDVSGQLCSSGQQEGLQSPQLSAPRPVQAAPVSSP